ncbi:VRR-NUC domain-containing protein [Cobetia sp. 3AK]|uniref:VRR-NUC domain-containing protein n=1 Tax=Cobetia sp. 3AK TaxID=3040020 RepID=UPI0024486384|nr:VRR-NUC domain-containing protein [Cobetia sp. 3AK]MDH2374777.1 VRR-NUC domain-containing protein [Cobetia sp. 3AK]
MQAAPLDNPRYYLANFDTLLDWVCQCHADLLTETERATVDAITRLPEPSRALLVRLLMRKGDHFEVTQLHYVEIGAIEAASKPLIIPIADSATPDGLCRLNADLSLEEMLSLVTLPRLKDAFPELPRSTPKRRMPDAISELLGDTTPRPLPEWLNDPAANTLSVGLGELSRRLSLMFFGNLRQTLSDFVLSELGLLRCEAVALSPDSRAFTQRWEVDRYLALEQLREDWQAARERLNRETAHAELEPHWQRIISALDEVTSSEGDATEVNRANAWLAQRRDRLRFSLARDAERQGWHHVAALQYACLEDSAYAPRAMPRRVRALELSGDISAAHALACERLARTDITLDEQLALERALPRLCRGLGLPAPRRAKAPATPQITLTVPDLATSAAAGIHGVERAAAHALATPEAPVFYVENGLLPALFTLLCWDVLFAPLPGAFFHAFHTGPADLYRPDFVNRRQAAFEDCFARLSDGRYRETIRERHQQKQGIQAPFVHWPLLSEELLSHALDCIPPAHLEACFRHLLANPREHRAGLPDLIQFFPENTRERYRMIEVKAPTDRLQDNQRQWLALFARHAIPALECRVEWQTVNASDASAEDEATARKAPAAR